MEITKEQILKLVDISCNRSVEEQLKEWYPEVFIEYNQWYWIDVDHPDHEFALVVLQDPDVLDTYGFNYAGLWTNNFGNRNTFVNRSNKIMRKATLDEVNERMNREAVKRGFSIGCKFQSINKGEQGQVRTYKPFYSTGGVTFKISKFTESKWQFYCTSGMYTQNDIFCSNPSIFIDGNWAEVIQEKELSMQEIADKFGIPVEHLKIKK